MCVSFCCLSVRRGGQHKLSMKLLASMVEAGLAPDAVTVGELISSLSDRGRWDEAQRVVEVAEKTGAIPPSSLDSTFEVDVSHLPPAIAKVKVRDPILPATRVCCVVLCVYFRIAYRTREAQQRGGSLV